MWPTDRKKLALAMSTPLSATFVAIVQRLVGKAAGTVATGKGHSKNTRFAVIGLPSGELTWAQLNDRQGSCLSASTSHASVPASELAALQAKLPSFLAQVSTSEQYLGQRKIDGAAKVSDLLKYMVDSSGQPARWLRAAPASAEVDFTGDEDGEGESYLNFQMILARLPDLKWVSLSRLEKCSACQLRELCTLAGISPVPDSDLQLVPAIIAFRRGRVERYGATAVPIV